MERLAEYYYDTGNTQAQAILAKWVSWAESVTSFNTSTGAICLPGTTTWSGQPGENYTSGSTPPPANTSLSVSVSGCSSDLGVSSSLAKVYEYYAAKSGNTAAETAAQNIIDTIHKYHADALGFSAPEARTDYSNLNGGSLRSSTTTGSGPKWISPPPSSRSRSCSPRCSHRPASRPSRQFLWLTISPSPTRHPGRRGHPGRTDHSSEVIAGGRARGNAAGAPAGGWK